MLLAFRHGGNLFHWLKKSNTTCTTCCTAHVCLMRLRSGLTVVIGQLVFYISDLYFKPVSSASLTVSDLKISHSSLSM